MVNTAELRQIFPLRENTLRHVVEGDGRYPRAMTPSAHGSSLMVFIQPKIGSGLKYTDVIKA